MCTGATARGECEREEPAWPWSPGLFCSGVSNRHPPPAGGSEHIELRAEKGAQILVVSGVLRVVLGSHVIGEMAIEERLLILAL